VHGQLAALRSEGIAPEHLERARNQIRLGVYTGMRTNMSLARQVGGYAVACGDPRYGERLLRAVEAVTREQAQAALERYLTAAPVLTVVQRPAQAGAATAAAGGAA
jgi:predicted Zn-dependent peptidase